MENAARTFDLSRLPMVLLTQVCPLSLQVFCQDTGVTTYNEITCNKNSMQQWREFCINRDFIPCVLQANNLVPMLGLAHTRALTNNEIANSNMAIHALSAALQHLRINVPGVTNSEVDAAHADPDGRAFRS